MNEAVAIMTGAAEPGAAGHGQVVEQARREQAAADAAGAGAVRAPRG
jgi:hypothetical protein